jgi:hypothetical protein
MSVVPSEASPSLSNRGIALWCSSAKLDSLPASKKMPKDAHASEDDLVARDQRGHAVRGDGAAEASEPDRYGIRRDFGSGVSSENY